jgi:putative DNA primase/helicase
MIVLRQTRSWYGHEDITLTDRLMGELPGIFCWATEGWRRLHARGHFVQPGSATRVVQELEDLASPIGAFIRERCMVGAGFAEPVDDLFRAWQRWCEDAGRREAGTKQSFGRDLRAALPGIETPQRRIAGTNARERVFQGIRLRTSQECEGAEEVGASPF